ncbi:MAG: hypothetical protein AABX38_00005 [Candidatus Micrarchaeota archaeon]
MSSLRFFKERKPTEQKPKPDSKNKFSKWKDYSPTTLLWKTYFLADDLVEKGISRVVKKVEQKTGKTKRKMAVDLTAFTFASVTAVEMFVRMLYL